MTHIRPFTTADSDAVVALWTDTGRTRPWNDPVKDIHRKTTTQPEMFLVAEDNEGQVVGSAVAGYDGRRGWIHYLAVAASHRGTGLGKELVRRVHACRPGLPQVQLQVRPDDAGVIGFYESLGYATYQAVSHGEATGGRRDSFLNSRSPATTASLPAGTAATRAVRIEQELIAFERDVTL